MIAHVVLLRPRADLTAESESALAAAFVKAAREIPSIRRARVGRRVRLGRGYEAQMHVDYQYAAVLEFDDVDGLVAYLDHPSHATLAARFAESVGDALMYDFELSDAGD